MAETMICPKCGCDVTEVMTAQLEAKIRNDLALEWRDREAEWKQKQITFELQREALTKERSAIDREVNDRLQKAEKQLKSEALAEARQTVSSELVNAQSELGQIRAKLQEALDQELQLRKEKQAVEDEKRNLALTVARQLDTERATIQAAAKQQADEEHREKEAQNNKKIADLLTQIDTLKRKAEQGSQQLQGEVLELDLEAILRREFPLDEILPVPKGVHGGDVVHLVRDGTGADCGIILWEFKNTKNWMKDWLPKLRDNQRAAKAHISILVSDELPKTVSTFSYVDEVWVTNRSCSIGLAIAIRSGMLQLAAARRSLEGRQGKMESLYNYLSSSEFQNRVNGILDAFQTLRKDLEAEKTAINRLWAKREKQIHQALISTSGMYGDLQGIIGGSLPMMEAFDLPALPSPDDEAQEIATSSVLPR